MPHIELGNDAPGIIGLFQYKPETAQPLSELAELLLRADNSLTRGERELIAAYVSSLNDCDFCASSHAWFAALQLPEGMALVDQVRDDLDAAPVGDKMRALLRIADSVRRGGRCVTPEQIAAARDAGASDAELHDTVLIAAAFCMFNRYVDGLATVTPAEPAAYAASAEMIVRHGYQAALG